MSKVIVPRGYTLVPLNPTSGVLARTNRSLSILICWNIGVIKDINKAPVVYKDSVSVIVPYLYANHECIIVRVVETPGDLLHEAYHEVVDSCYLGDETCQLDVLNHPQVGLARLPG